MSSRILKVNPGQYDQVVAVTQAMINAGMENLYIAKTPDPPKPQTIAIRAAGGMNNVLLKAPRIIVSPVQNNLSQVIYVMGFSAGTLAVYSTDGSDEATADDKTNYDMTNWSKCRVRDAEELLTIFTRIRILGRSWYAQL